MNDIKLKSSRFVETEAIVMPIEAETKEFNKEMKLVANALDKTEAKMNDVLSVFGKLPRNGKVGMEVLKSVIKDLGAETKKLQTRLEKMSGSKFKSSSFDTSKDKMMNDLNIEKARMGFTNGKSDDEGQLFSEIKFLEKYNDKVINFIKKEQDVRQKAFNDRLSQAQAAAQKEIDEQAKVAKENERNLKKQVAEQKKADAEKKLADKQRNNENLLASFKTIGNDPNSEASAAFKSKVEALIEEQNKEVQSSVIKRMLTSEIKKQTNAVMEQIEALRQEAEGTKKNISILEAFRNVIKRTENDSNKSAKGFKAWTMELQSIAVRWRILAGLARSVVNVFADVYEKAASYEESLNLYTVALGSYADEGRKWAERISTALYLDPTQIMQYTGALYNLVQGLGVASDDAYTMATNLTQLSYDMSSYLNIDVESAFTKLQSAITGQARAVASAGVAMQVASLQELAYSMGIEKSVKDMTQAEKTYLRYIQVMRSTANMQGDLARTIVTPENALRVVKQQFTLLARAIGQVFIPIVLKAIPYVMALTEALKKLATWLGGKLGYQVADIDYSNLKDLDTYLENSADSAEDTSKSIKGVGDSVNRTLAAFDELNVVESKSSGSGGAGLGGVGGGDSILPKLKDYITGYDMLEGYTDQFKKQIGVAEENLKKFWNVAKKVLVVLAAWKALKLAVTIMDWVDKFKKLFNEGTPLGTLFKAIGSKVTSMITTFKGARDASLALGNTGLTAIRDGFANMLGPMGTAVATIGLVVGSFVSADAIMSKADTTASSMAGHATLATLAVAGFTTAAAVAFGPEAAILVGVAGAVGLLKGLSEKLTEEQRLLEEQKKYNTLFDGMGVSIDTVKSQFDGMVTTITRNQTAWETLSGKVSTSKTSFDEAKEAFYDAHQAIETGAYSNAEEAITKLQEVTNNYKTELQETTDAELDFNTKMINDLLKKGVISKQEHDAEIKRLKEIAEKRVLYNSKYAEDLYKLDKQLATGAISQEIYNERVEELSKQYAGVVDVGVRATDVLAGMYMKSVEKIDLKNPKDLLYFVNDLRDSYNEGTKSIESQKKTFLDGLDPQIKGVKEQIAVLDALREQHGSLSKQQEETYKDLTDKLKILETDRKKTLEGFDSDTKSLQAQYKNYLLTIYAQIGEAGKIGDKDVKDTVKNMTTELNKLADVDLKDAAVNMFDKYALSLKTQGKHVVDNLGPSFEKWGVNMSDDLYHGFISEASYVFQNSDLLQNAGFKTWVNSNGKIMNENGKELGKNLDEGLGLGITDNTKKCVVKPGTDMCLEAIKGAKDELGVHSPSTVFYEIGLNLVQGLGNGISQNTKVATDSISKLTNSMQERMKNLNLKLEFDTNVTTSFNKILSKLQTFANHWRSGINDLLSKTKTAFNSITLGMGTKLAYSAMGVTNIAKFENGGYPTSGDLFFANENGRAEYIASVGNKTAVANQDQMVSALANAITNAMGSITANNRPGITQVYIGNDKVYEGQGKYQNREADRYGVSYIKI